VEEEFRSLWANPNEVCGRAGGRPEAGFRAWAAAETLGTRSMG
jgi:hypothetical protein